MDECLDQVTPSSSYARLDLSSPGLDRRVVITSSKTFGGQTLVSLYVTVSV